METKRDTMTGCHDHGTHCAEVPELKRLRYFYGQLLGVHDFQTEQDYFREKLKLHNRCLHGYGTVCGLEVVPEPRDQTCVPKSDADLREIEARLHRLEEPIARAQKNVASFDEDMKNAQSEEAKKAITERLAAQRRELDKLTAEREGIELRRDAMQKNPAAGTCPEERPTRVTIECGLALDCEGNEIVVRHPLHVDLWHYLDDDDRRRARDGQSTLYLSICYCEQPVDPVRPVLSDACGAALECTFGKLRDAVKIRVTIDPPAADPRCETCCEPCADACQVLARIDGFTRGGRLEAGDIDNSVRRLVGIYPSTTITGINWTHGAEYDDAAAAEILGSYDESKGLTVTFSRPVLTSTLTPGVVDIWVLQGGEGRSGDIYNVPGVFEGIDPKARTTTEFRYRATADEDLDPGDRVLITVRCAFILDECCRPVDGMHAGGRVPFIEREEFARFKREAPRDDCRERKPHYGPWTSGPGAPGASFESWFYVARNDSAKTPRGRRYPT